MMATIQDNSQLASLRCLYIIREVARFEPDSIRDILSADSDLVNQILKEPECRFLGCVCFLALREFGYLPTSYIRSFIERIRSLICEGQPFSTIPSSIYIKSDERPRVITDLNLIPDYLIHPENKCSVSTDSSAIYSAFIKALTFIERIYPDAASGVRTSVDYLIGLDRPWGEINCFSNECVPGLVAFSINNPSVLLAEQILHETTHISLNSYFGDNSADRDIISNLPLLYSPFTKSVRPALRVVHGVISYSFVLRLWSKVRGSIDLLDGLLDGISLDQIIEKADQRIRHLSSTVALGIRSSLTCVSSEEQDSLLKVYAYYGVTDDQIDANYKRRGTIPFVGSLVEQAELLLAVNGHKVSRICCGIGNFSLYETLIELGVRYSLSKHAYLPQHSSLLRGFSNTFSSMISIDRAPHDAEVLCYVGNESNAIINARLLDAYDKAWSYFGIPRCCASFYLRHWGRPDLVDADLFALLLNGMSLHEITLIPWQCNAAAMYFGGGLCWHFPCSFDCKETIQLVNNRLYSLMCIDAELALKLKDIQQATFYYNRNEGYCLSPHSQHYITIIPDSSRGPNE